MSNRSNVPWYSYGPDDTETIIAAAISAAYPGAERVEGSGGDGGVDVRRVESDGLHVFEIKSFHQTLSKSQRKQVVASLKTATKQHPDMVRWTLVLPHDLTPAEIVWIDTDLRPLTHAEIDYHGRTWVELKLGENPAIQRMFAPGAPEHRALDLLRGMDREQAALGGGVPDLAARMQNLHLLGDSIDPNFAFDASVTDRGVHVTVRPKHAGAIIPVYDLLRVSAEAGHAEDVSRFETYGIPLRASGVSLHGVHLPGQIAANIEPEDRADIALGPAEVWQQPGRLFAEREGRAVASLAVVFDARSRGSLGGSWFSARDQMGLLTIEFTIESDGKGVVQYSTEARTREFMPGELLPILRYMKALEEADTLRIESTAWAPASVTLRPDLARFAEVQKIVWFGEALARIQVRCNVEFPMPDHWTQMEAQTLSFLDHLVTTGRATWPWIPSVIRVPVEVLREHVLNGWLIPRLGMGGSSAGEETPFTLFGHELVLPGKLVMTMKYLAVVNGDELSARLATTRGGELLDVRVQADDQSSCFFSLE